MEISSLIGRDHMHIIALNSKTPASIMALLGAGFPVYQCRHGEFAPSFWLSVILLDMSSCICSARVESSKAASFFPFWSWSRYLFDKFPGVVSFHTPFAPIESPVVMSTCTSVGLTSAGPFTWPLLSSAPILLIREGPWFTVTCSFPLFKECFRCCRAANPVLRGQPGFSGTRMLQPCLPGATKRMSARKDTVCTTEGEEGQLSFDHHTNNCYTSDDVRCWSRDNNDRLFSTEQTRPS